MKHSQLHNRYISEKFVHFNQLIVVSFDVEQKPHTLDIQISFPGQKCMQFIIGIKITLPADRDTLREIYPLIYIQEYSPPQW